MGQIPFKKIVGNTPGKDKRTQKPDFTAKVEAIPYKNAVMGRSKFPSKSGSAKRDVHLA